MKKFFLGSVLFLAIAVVFFNCKKNSDKKAVCNIRQLIQDSVVDNFTYDDKGRLSNIAIREQLLTFEYSDNKTIITTSDAGQLWTTTTVVLNQAGLAINARMEDNQSVGVWTNFVYEYNGDQLTRATITYSNGNPSQVINYQWTGGNMTSAVIGSDTTHYDYYTNKATQAGDYLSLVQLVSGYQIYRTKNLLKSVGTNSFIYTFDADGKITSVGEVLSGAGASQIQLQYECN